MHRRFSSFLPSIGVERRRRRRRISRKESNAADTLTVFDLIFWFHTQEHIAYDMLSVAAKTEYKVMSEKKGRHEAYTRRADGWCLIFITSICTEFYILRTTWLLKGKRTMGLVEHIHTRLTYNYAAQVAFEIHGKQFDNKY